MKFHSILFGSITFAAMFSVIACTGDSLVDPEGSQLSRLPEAEHLRVLDSGVRVFRSEAEWVDFWDSHVNVFSSSLEPVPAPEVDFDRLMLVGVFMGDAGRSGCHNQAALIREALITRSVLQIEVGSLPSLGACTMIVYPLDVVVLPKFEGRIEFVGSLPE
jgi:hypothetical protein